jgi:RNA polymerase sigma-70 factor (sigma-E family)
VTFEQYVHEHGQELLRLAFVLTGDAPLAEDLTQTALADAYRHWRKVSGVEYPHAYVRRMLVNAHLNWRRRRSSTERPADLRGRTGDTAPDHADDVAARDETRRLLATLGARTRAILVLRYFADLSDADIAGTLDIAESTVRATASRALTQLRSTTPDEALEESS